MRCCWWLTTKGDEMKLQRIRKALLHSIGVLLAMVALLQQSLADDSSRDVQFHGTLKERECIISNDKLIEIHFGEVGINKIDGNNYKQPLPYTVSCDDPQNATQTLMLSLQGNQSTFDTAGLETTVRGLAIRIYKEGMPMDLNKPVVITYNALPRLDVAPEKDGTTDLTAQGFTATATLLAEYQ